MSGSRMPKAKSGRRWAGRAVMFGTVFGVASACARADSWTNSTGNGLWQISDNWFDGGVPQSTDPVTFPTPGPASHLVTLPTGATVVAQSLTFDDDYTLNGGRLDMIGAPIAVAAGKIATVNSQVG